MKPQLLFMKLIAHLQRGGTWDDFTTTPRVVLSEDEKRRIDKMIEEAGTADIE